MQAVLNLASSGVETNLANLKSATRCCKATLRKYLAELANKGFVRIDCVNKRGGISRIIVLRNETPTRATRSAATPPPAKSAAALPALPPAPPPAPAATQPNPKPEPSAPLVVVLVDHDNTYSTACEAGFSLSFAKLKALVRECGRIMFADVFLSPASTKPDVIAKLWEAGFQAVACPMGFKDKDAVDAKILVRAMQYLERTAATKIVIVSRDRDFQGLADQAADLGKTVIFVDVAKEQERLAGEDVMPVLFPRKETEQFERTFGYLVNRQSDQRPGGKERAKFLRDIIQVLRRLDPARRRAFKSLVSDVTRELESEDEQTVVSRDMQAALTALVNGGVLVKNEDAGRTWYVFDAQHRACANI